MARAHSSTVIAVKGRSMPCRFSRRSSSTVSGAARPRACSSSTREKIYRGAPSMATTPSFMTMTRSASSASDIWWVMCTTVIPRSRFSR